MTELKWIEWPHSRCPVPAETIVHIRRNGCTNDGLKFNAGMVNWCSIEAPITAFAIDPDQPAQLGDFPEVGASYLCRDGKVRVCTSWEGDGSVANFSRGSWYTSGRVGPKGCCSILGNTARDAIARLYLPAEPSAPASRPFLKSLRAPDPSAKEAADYAAWLARAEDKCRNVAAIPRKPARSMEVIAESNGHHWISRPMQGFPDMQSCRDCGIVRRKDDHNKPCKGIVKIGMRTIPTSFGVPCNFDTMRGHLFGYWRKS